jgi:isoleucyl-tRNA synthetase
LSVASVPAEAFTLSDVPGIAVAVRKAPGERCERCWRVLPEVGHAAGHADLCGRCADAVGAGAAAGTA